MTVEVPPITVAVEGIIDEIVVRRVLDHVNLPHGTFYGLRGRQDLLARLRNYNVAAERNPWFVLVDLDQKPDCAPLLVETVLPSPAQGMCFRVAVRAVEAWLLADSEHVAQFLSVRETQVPNDPDAELNPKVSLVNLARQSTKRVVKEAIVPREGSGGLVAPDYTRMIREFVTVSDHRWRPEVAMQHSDSLRRCVVALQTLKDWTPN
jgi:hypothetical protein